VWGGGGNKGRGVGTNVGPTFLSQQETPGLWGTMKGQKPTWVDRSVVLLLRKKNRRDAGWWERNK